MNRVLSGREEILRVERRLYTDSMSSVMKSLTALEHKYEDMHSRELISENRFSQYIFDLLRIRCNILHGMMQREKAFDLLEQLPITNHDIPIKKLVDFVIERKK